MPTLRLITCVLLMAFLAGCGHADKPSAEQTQSIPPLTGDAAILQAWPGDFPVARLDRLPADQREQGIGYIDERDIFAAVWAVFKPGEALPNIDFAKQLVLFARNTQYFNRISAGKVMVKEGTAELLAMETLSARLIEDKVAMALVVVPQAGITGLRAGSIVIPIK